ncbi:MAG: apolipoprotein N-acyltransferase, partial [Spirochaetales bacterium]
TPICFEDAFPYLCRNFVRQGAEMLINLTNDSWSKTDSAQIQHFVAARFRSIENRTVLVRSTNAGVTSVIDPHGRLIHSLPYFTEAFLAASIPVYSSGRSSFYTRFGDFLPYLCLGLCFAYLVILRLRFSK